MQITGDLNDEYLIMSMILIFAMSSYIPVQKTLAVACENGWRMSEQTLEKKSVLDDDMLAARTIR